MRSGCASQPAGAPSLIYGAATPALAILQSELQRNFQVLKTAADAGVLHELHDVHDERSSSIVASFGALQRSDDSRSRFATVEVRVGDYQLDNTHPIRGDSGRRSPRISQVALPLTDDEKPIRLALWRATDRTFKQASEALTRVKTNVAAKIKEEDPAPDFSREEPQTYTGDAGQLHARHQGVGGAAAPHLGAVRRRSARVPQRRVAVGRSRQPLLHQQRRLAGRHRRRRVPALHPGGDQGRRRHGAAALLELLRDDRPTGCPTRSSSSPTSASMMELLAQPAQGAARRSVLRPGDSLGPRRRRVLPRDLRPPRRRQPPAERRRRPDVREQRRPAGAAVVPERRLRSDAAEARRTPS